MSFRLTGTALLTRWHKMLALPHQSPPSWYSDRLREEIQELAEAQSYILKLSETSDVFFSISRAKHDGYPIGRLRPCNTPRNVLVYAYMIGKFSLRCGFYLVAAKFCGVKDWRSVRAVVNPKKDRKIDAVAQMYGIDPVAFGRVGRRLRWVWPLLL
ncbi:MAG: hypothetical protein M1812_006720 [Candelaria pacifica]|nr:MAG: hypothetical protein M1812_006720 [Candelaria pacifica]